MSKVPFADLSLYDCHVLRDLNGEDSPEVFAGACLWETIVSLWRRNYLIKSLSENGEIRYDLSDKGRAVANFLKGKPI